MKRLLIPALLVTLLAAGCADAAGTATEPPPSAPTAEPDDAAMRATGDHTTSVVRVVATGTFVTPDFGQLDTVAGSGSAFIIDPSGIAVTNNHVVAGAASVEVFFDNSSTPIAATVVARSECADLAVIALAGGGYQALDWVAEDGGVGLEVRAAGYPDGHPALTVTGGIVARVDDSGATPWASIPSLVRHDADISPGNSGGPIVDSTGAVVGVNVAASGSGRYAIPMSVARPVVDALRTGVDVDSIGVNAVAVRDDITNDSGVWVVSVEPGSLAAAAGVRPGDVITRMKSIRVGKDATLADYCAVVRSTGDGELPIEITRDGTHLAGSLRGDPLVPVLEVNDRVVATASAPPPAVTAPPPAGVPYVAFDTVVDDTGTVSFDVPTDWTSRRTSPVRMAGANRPSIAAGFDLDALDAASTYDQAGVAAIVYSADVTIDDAFATIIDNSPWAYDCTPLQREQFEDTLYTGAFQAFMDCAGSSATVFTIAIRRVGDPHWMLLNIFAPTIADLEAATRIAATLDFTPNPATVTTAAGNDTSDNTPAELPATVSTIEDVINIIGPPPSGEEMRVVEQTAWFISVAYTSTAPENELHAWAIERAQALGCASPETSSTGDSIVTLHTVRCELDAVDYSATIRMFTTTTGGTDVEVSVYDWNPTE